MVFLSLVIFSCSGTEAVILLDAYWEQVEEDLQSRLGRELPGLDFIYDIQEIDIENYDRIFLSPGYNGEVPEGSERLALSNVDIQAGWKDALDQVLKSGYQMEELLLVKPGVSLQFDSGLEALGLDGQRFEGRREADVLRFINTQSGKRLFFIEDPDSAALFTLVLSQTESKMIYPATKKEDFDFIYGIVEIPLLMIEGSRTEFLRN
jgi:hypothetical protein